MSHQSTILQETIAVAAPAGVGAAAPSRRRAWHRARLWSVLLLLMLPTLGGMALFTYYPQYSAVKYSLYKWDGGQTVEEYRGLENFQEAFTQDTRFWACFSLVLILLAANLVKMWPSILTAVVLHRVRSERWQYIYRVLFVVPMIIPGIVALLIWKNFFDPDQGVLNKAMAATGITAALRWLDGAMPVAAAKLSPAFAGVIDPLFGSVWGMLVAGVLLLSATRGPRSVMRAWGWWAILLATGFFVMGPAALGVWAGVALGTGAVLYRQYGEAGRDYTRWAGAAVLVAAGVLILLGKTWTEPTRAFLTDQPNWLSNSKLIVPSLIIWGFPWVGTVGVLIYLAGLQNISQDVYEAAEIDGVGTIGKLFRIELPLILTQVRINLIFMTIGTLSDYYLVLLLLGPSGGPGGAGLTPGLYMYSQAFLEGRFGYACALGMVLFVIILAITILYQRYVKVEK